MHYSCRSMHMTRPKSSKGRSRPSVNHSLHVGESGDMQNKPLPPKPPMEHNTESYLHPQSHCLSRQSSPLSQDEVVHMLQLVPTVPALSLNKYKVLPCIGKKQSDVVGIEKETSKLSLYDNGVSLQQQPRHGELNLPTATQTATNSNPDIGSTGDIYCRDSPKPQEPDHLITKPEREKHDTLTVDAAGSLLLAIRSPCGRRFQQLFHHTDTLLMLIASAEARFETNYREAFVETMDVPRRTFTDLDMTLAQCGIVNRSVMCISEGSV